MFCLKSKLKIHYIGTVEAYHNVSLICDHAFFAALKQSFFLHQFESIKTSCTFQSGQKYTTEPTCANTFDDFEVFEADLLDTLVFPNGLNL